MRYTFQSRKRIERPTYGEKKELDRTRNFHPIRVGIRQHLQTSQDKTLRLNVMGCHGMPLRWNDMTKQAHIAHRRPCGNCFFTLSGVICPSPLFNTTSSEFLTVPNNNLRGLRCLLCKGRPRRGSWCWWNSRVESCLIDGINIDHLKLSTGDAIQPCTNKDVKKTGQQSWS